MACTLLSTGVWCFLVRLPMIHLVRGPTRIIVALSGYVVTVATLTFPASCILYREHNVTRRSLLPDVKDVVQCRQIVSRPKLCRERAIPRLFASLPVDIVRNICSKWVKNCRDSSLPTFPASLRLYSAQPMLSFGTSHADRSCYSVLTVLTDACDIFECIRPGFCIGRLKYAAVTDISDNGRFAMVMGTHFRKSRNFDGEILIWEMAFVG
ncbi:uncharacterized protein LOC143179574 [Calliopsis andreniformis]|uniref:uncharacterized protein LOC143179574 n=1 Tax=Calliopsis andreniformis TaxID=337506 RepID=UPI003FCEA580